MDRQERIDWSKAPEDAQFWNPDTQNDWECWLKYEDLSWWFKRVGAECREWREAVVDDATVRVMVARSPSTNNEHHDHKEGEGVKWEPGVDLPPVGVECEYKRLNVHHRSEFIRVNPIFFSDQICVLEHAMSGNQFAERLEDCEFRPIQTHRDKVIEAAMADIDQDWYAQQGATVSEYVENAVVQLYNRGWLKVDGISNKKASPLDSTGDPQ